MKNNINKNDMFEGCYIKVLGKLTLVRDTTVDKDSVLHIGGKTDFISAVQAAYWYFKWIRSMKNKSTGGILDFSQAQVDNLKHKSKLKGKNEIL